jgi:hypothetical protein
MLEHWFLWVLAGMELGLVGFLGYALYYKIKAIFTKLKIN